MATDAIVVFEQLRCVTLRLTESRTEPYIWPVLIRVDDNTIATDALVAVTAPLQANARVVIKDSMRAGETAAIPGSVGILRTRFEDNLTFRHLVLVVALLEEDETPKSAMLKGFQAFISELRAAIAENLLDLSATTGEDLQALIDAIKKRVEDKVKSAIRGGLSAWEKAKVAAGILNLDDAVGSAFVSFGDPVLVPTPIGLTFEKKEKVLGVETIQRYEILGQLQLRPVRVDRCQAQVNAVNAALAVVKDIEKRIQDLKNEFAQASVAEREIIRVELDEAREELAAAEAVLEGARRALAICRSRLPSNFPDTAEQVLG